MKSSDSLPPLRQVIAAHGLSARKALGQNFLLDLNLTRRIAREAGVTADTEVCEIGPGPGGLTRALLMEGARRVVVIEKDERCIQALHDVAAAYPGRLEIVSGDALEIDQEALFSSGRPVHVVANLPYNISTVLLTKWLETEVWPPWFSSLTLMFQREVAQRIVAMPGTKAYGRLSVLCQWRATPRILFDVSPRAFVPQPKVTSSVVRLDPRSEPVAPAPMPALKRVLAAAFGQRRKMLRSSLKALGVDVHAVLRHAGIDPAVRAETLGVIQFCALARAVEEFEAR
ncbi:MAG: 16S rRNA (adenine(1518)-N(6)/adenine(1519)-N(6))-dimethyltransferase RsmA [Sphingomonadales bacterium]